MDSDQLRRQLRQQLHQQRVKDNDHSAERYALDAKRLDQGLKDAGLFIYPAMWGDTTQTRKRNAS